MKQRLVVLVDLAGTQFCFFIVAELELPIEHVTEVDILRKSGS
jgi:hypothetical protein